MNTGLFRQWDVQHEGPTGLDVLLGESAVSNLESMRHRVRPASDDSTLLDLTMEEVQSGCAQGPFAAAEIDSKFGAGGWRPLGRFLHHQPDRKVRQIDSGKAPGHNAATCEEETIYTTSVDVIPAVMQAVLALVCQTLVALGDLSPNWQELPIHEVLGQLPQWLSFLLGTEDMVSTYRQHPVLLDHLAFTCVAFRHCQFNDFRFIVLLGMPFGMSSSVINFCRTPALHTAFGRRYFGVVYAAFFDDTGITDLSCCAQSSQVGVQLIYHAAGTHLDPGKSQVMALQRACLGLSVNVGAATFPDNVLFDLKPGFQHGTDAIVCQIFEEERCTSGTASSLRGRFRWAATATFGRCARGGQSALVARQYYDREECLTAPLSHDLIFHKMLPLVVGIRQVPVLHFRRPTCVIYSDASYEISDPFPARLGLVYFDDSGSKPLGLAAVVSHTELSALQCRMQQITACEMMPVLYFLLSHSSLVAGRDVLWWIDNQASVSLLIKGSSSQQDLAAISAAVHLYSAHLGCRLWLE